MLGKIQTHCQQSSEVTSSHSLAACGHSSVSSSERWDNRKLSVIEGRPKEGGSSSSGYKAVQHTMWGRGRLLGDGLWLTRIVKLLEESQLAASMEPPGGLLKTFLIQCVSYRHPPVISQVELD